MNELLRKERFLERCLRIRQGLRRIGMGVDHLPEARCYYERKGTVGNNGHPGGDKALERAQALYRRCGGMAEVPMSPKALLFTCITCIFVPLLLGGCVLPGQFQGLSDEVRVHMQEAKEAMRLSREGSISRDDLERKLERSNDAIAKEIDAFSEKVAAQTREVLRAATEAASGQVGPATQALIATGVTGLMGVVYEGHRRRRRPAERQAIIKEVSNGGA